MGGSLKKAVGLQIHVRLLGTSRPPFYPYARARERCWDSPSPIDPMLFFRFLMAPVIIHVQILAGRR